MWARVDDHLDEHKKVFIAGERLGGPNATGRVLAVWLEGRLWSNRNNTLGFIPMNIVQRFQHDEAPMTVAAALAAPITDDERERWNLRSTNCLWIPVTGGFQFHDDEDYRPKVLPEAVRAKRSAAGRLGGQASGAKRKQTAKQSAEQTTKQLAIENERLLRFASEANVSGSEAATLDDCPPHGQIEANEANLKQNWKQNEQQNTNPVSRIPVQELNTAAAPPDHPVETVENPQLPLMGSVQSRTPRELAKEPNGDNFHVIAKLAGDLIDQAWWEADVDRVRTRFTIATEQDLRTALKDECGRLRIDRSDLGVITRAAASEWHKHQLGLRRRA